MSSRESIRAIAKDLGRLWIPFLVTDLLTKLLVFALLAPVTAGALRLFLRLGGRGSVVADEEILDFLLSSAGLLTVLIVGGLTLGVIFLEHATLVVTALLGQNRESVRARDAIWSAARRFPSLVRLGAAMLVRALPIVLPLLLGVGGYYVWLLTDYDINYYLTVQPPQWRRGLVLAGMGSVVAGFLLLRMAAGWFLAIPILLVEGVPARAALEKSRVRIGKRRFQTVLWFVGWVAVSIVTGIVLTFGLGLLARVTAISDLESLRLSAVALVLLFALTTVGNAIVTYLSWSVLALLVSRLFLDWTDGAEDLMNAWLARESMETPAASKRGGLIHARAVLIGAAVVLIGVGAMGVFQVLERLESRDSALVIAHRGSSAEAPENTIAAVVLSLDQGTDWVEIDVQETADGRVAVVHDRDLMKVAGVPIRIGASTWSQIDGVDVGSWFSPEFSGESVPLLSDVLEASRDRGGVVIELKYYGHEQALEARVVEVVERLGMEDQVKFMSLKLSGVRALKALRPDWTVGLLTAVAIGDVLRLADIDFHAVNSSLATIPFMRRAHSLGQDVYIWTVNDPINMSVLTSKGADGIITDYPEVAREAMVQHAGLSPFERLLFFLAYSLDLVEVEEPSSEGEA